MKAYILINTKLGEVNEVLVELRKMEEIKNAYSTTGPYDIIALMESEDLVSLGNIIVQKVQKVEGVSSTLTCVVAESA